VVELKQVLGVRVEIYQQCSLGRVSSKWSITSWNLWGILSIHVSL